MHQIQYTELQHRQIFYFEDKPTAAAWICLKYANLDNNFIYCYTNIQGFNQGNYYADTFKKTDCIFIISA